jgi:hypothetical protein
MRSIKVTTHALEARGIAHEDGKGILGMDFPDEFCTSHIGCADRRGFEHARSHRTAGTA